MNFNVDTKISSFDQNESFNKMLQDREAQRQSGYSGGPANVFGLIDVVGLNAKEIPNMQAAITQMCENIKKELNKMETDIDSSGAYKGEGIQAALQTYLTNVANYCSNLTSNLRAFNDKLTDVKNQWDNATAAMQENISGNAGQFAQGSQYTEKLQ